MKFLFLMLVSFSAFGYDIKHSERLGLVETCVQENESFFRISEATGICEYRSKKTKVRSCAMARGAHYGFAVDCALFDEVYPKK